MKRALIASALAGTAALVVSLPGAFATGYRLFGLWTNLFLHFHDKRRLDPQRGMADVVGLNPAAWRHYPGFRMPQVPRLAAPRL